jgi:signal transduction histidine kinase
MIPAEPLLIIDDEPQLRMNLRILLERLGFQVREAGNGREGLEACAREHPALVLLDARMPEMDGYEVCARLQQDPVLREIPVIFMSGLLDPQDRVRALEAGAVDFMTKPYHLAEVQARVRTHLELQEQRRGLRQRNEELRLSLEEMEVLNRKLLELNERLRQSEGLKSRFLAMMRNEINNPLASLLAAGRELGDPALARARVAALGKVVASEAFGLDFQIQNIFCAAELESGEIFPAIAAVEVRSVIQDVLDSFGHEAVSRAVELVLEAPADPPVFWTDAGKLRLIVANLISNAIKFNHPGGSVKVQIHQAEGALCLEVEDTGCGIASELQAAIFERFHQLQEGPSRPHTGQGLGLSVAKALAEFLGGSITLTSTPGQGSRFICRLPVSLGEGMNPIAIDGNIFFFGDPESRD